jgi:uncharacterized protein (TIGR03086 family)
MDELATMRRVIELTGAVVDRIEPEQLTNPTPCAAWTVREVLNHLVAGAELYGRCVRDGSVSDAALHTILTTDALGDDHRASYHRAMGAALDAFAMPGAMDRIVRLPMGEMPVRLAMDIAIVDVTTHAWDLAVATGQPTDLDPDVVSAAYFAARTLLSDDLRATGRFGPMVEIADDAPWADRLAALTGRTP